MGFNKCWELNWLDILSTLFPAWYSALMPSPTPSTPGCECVCVYGLCRCVCLLVCVRAASLSVSLHICVSMCTYRLVSVCVSELILVTAGVSSALNLSVVMSVSMCVYFKLMILSIHVLLCILMGVCACCLCVCQVWRICFLPCGRTYQSHPSIISLHYVFMSFCVCRAVIGS